VRPIVDQKSLLPMMSVKLRIPTNGVDVATALSTLKNEIRTVRRMG
jgi:hypothetical protein